MDPRRIDLSTFPRARAIYDNQSDSPQELNFKCGDILYVVERDVAGYSGWWFCHSGQKFGIAPGNRLKMLPPPPADDFDVKRSTSKISHGEARDQPDLSNYDVPLRLMTAGSTGTDGDPWKMRREATEKSSSSSSSIYDKPVHGSCATPTRVDLCSPNRSSLLSIMSTGSSAMSDSTRSSVDASSVAYDVLPNRFAPPPSLDRSPDFSMKHPNSLRGRSAEDQRDSYLEDYSVPRIARRGSDAAGPLDPATDLYDSPRAYQTSPGNAALPEQNSDQLYDVPQLVTLEKALLKPFDVLNLIADTPDTIDSNNREKSEECVAHWKGEEANSIHSLGSIPEDPKVQNALKTQVPILLSSVLHLQSEIQRHNSTLRSYILLQCSDDMTVGFGQQQNLHYAQVKLSCLSLKTAVKELVDLCSEANMRSILNKNNNGGSEAHAKKEVDLESLKIRIDLLRSALKQFEDQSIDFSTVSPSRFRANASYQSKELLAVANVLPQITDLLVIDLCAQCGISVPQEKPSAALKTSSENQGGEIYAPLPPLRSRMAEASDQNSMRNRPLPPTPIQNDETRSGHASSTATTASNTLPLQSGRSSALGGHALNRYGSLNVSQRLSCPLSLAAQEGGGSFALTACRGCRGCRACSSFPVGGMAADLARNAIDSSQTQCQAQSKPPLLPPFHQQLHHHSLQNHHLHGYDIVESANLSDGSDRSQSDPLLGSAESDALLVDFYASQIDSHMELVRKASTDFKKTMAGVDSSDDNHRFNHRIFPPTPPRPIPSSATLACNNKLHHGLPSGAHSQAQTLTSQFDRHFSPPPKEFVLRSKFVILAAHKLVYVADAISRNLADSSRYNDVAAAANGLCDVLKSAVNATKEAALSHDNLSKLELMKSSLAEVEVRSGELSRVISKYRRPQK